jgi:tRNA-specific 2-thiouridylase
VREVHGEFQLLKARDASKDQSYFLHRLNQEQLANTLFPLGEMNKTEVRRLAEQLKLPNARKKDSTGICFIGERPFREFLHRYLAFKPGDMVTPEGRVVGQHVGLSFYTFGQRKGIGLGGSKDGSGAPWFVADKDVANNRLLVVQGHDHELLLSCALQAKQMSWVSGCAPAAGTYNAKTRYRQADAACQLHLSAEGFDLEFSQPQWAVTPGQSAVVYQGEVCLGGGIIHHVDRSTHAWV